MNSTHILLYTSVKRGLSLVQPVPILALQSKQSHKHTIGLSSCRAAMRGGQISNLKRTSGSL